MFTKINLDSISLATTFFSSIVIAQSDVWSGLARSQFDSAALTLRIPCVAVEDESGDPVTGLAPAYALNLLLSSDEPGNERFRLVEPIAEFTEIPESCLDTLTVSNDASSATYSTSSTEIDTDAAAFADRFYTLELQANLLLDGPVEFSLVNAESRDYSRPIFVGETFIAFLGPPPFNAEFIFDDDFLDEAMNAWNSGLVVFEPGQVENNCFFDDPDDLLEVIEVVGTNVRYRLKSTVTSADNNKEVYLVCTAFNHDINRLEREVQIYARSLTL